MEPVCSFRIRGIKCSEIDDILAIEKRCFDGSKAYTMDEFDHLINRTDSTCLVALQDGRIVGFIIVTYGEMANAAMIETIDVDPLFQNMGIGSALLREAEREIRLRGINRAQLEVAERSEKSLWIYRKAGYEVTEFLEKYYHYENSGSRNAFRMVKALN